MSAKKQPKQNAPGGAPLTGEKLLRSLEQQHRGQLQISRHSEKVAAALMDVAKPVVGKAKKLAQMQQGLQTATLAWNLAILPEDKKQEMFEQAMAPVKWPFRWFVRRMITSLIARKQELYPKEFRMIADVQVSGEAPNWNLKVATVQGAQR